MTTCLFIIDPQRDFMDERDTPMPVPGAVIDMMNLTDMIYQYGDQIDKIVVSLDQHPFHHIAHPEMWLDTHFRNPQPFDQITYADILAGRWHSADETLAQIQGDYVRDAELAGFGLTIWPRHCIIGSKGATLCPRLANDLSSWANPKRRIHFYTKSANWSTEHISAFKTIVPRVDDGTTWFNSYLLEAIKADTILIAGEALSHGIKETIGDVLGASFDLGSHMVILEDCTSPRPGYKVQAQEFLHQFCTGGGKLSRTDSLFKNQIIYYD